MLRDKSQHFDLVLSDVYMPGMCTTAPWLLARQNSGDPQILGISLADGCGIMQMSMGSSFLKKLAWNWIFLLSVSTGQHLCVYLESQVSAMSCTISSSLMVALPVGSDVIKWRDKCGFARSDAWCSRLPHQASQN